VLLDPTAIFDPGCQLSFLPFVFLDWAVPWLFPEREEDPLDELLFDSLPLWQQWLRSMGWEIGRAYLINLLVWVGIAPLVAYHSNLVPPAAILLAPPLTLLASIALFFGFLVLLLGSWAGPLAWPVLWSLGLCEWLIDVVDTRTEPIWVGSVSGLWLTVGYVGIIALVTHENLRTRWRLAIVPLLGWLCLPMMLSGSLVPGELRCTFLAVGHGGCAVIELPDGKVILYDAGSMRGPEVGSRVIVPYLWSRGIRRVDEVILSHADLDHYNALIEVAERITIGRVLTGEMFEQRERAAVVATLAMLKRRGIPHEIIAAGDRIGPMEYGLSVIHPPREFRAETENARSVVLEIEHHKQVLLLSGDLEAEGLARVLKLQPRRVDILQAPHHGSHRVDTKGLKNWCRGLRFVVSCQGEPRSALQGPGMYAGTRFVTTHEFGAVTVRLTARGTVIDVHRKMRDLLLIEATQDEGER
jgi:competence protein ComEC